MSLNGIDISKWQGDINLSKVPSDFVIVKATQGTSYVNPYLNKLDEAISLGKLVGVYHYCSTGGAKNEVTHFVNTIKKYIGKVLLVLDWEGEGNPNFGNSSYILEVMDEVYNQTKVKPIIYQSKSVCRTSGMDKIAAKYELWCAQYASMNPQYGYSANPWTDNKGFGPWTSPIIYQYSSRGQLSGYSGNLDLDIAYMTKNDWDARCKLNTIPSPASVTNVGITYIVTAANALNIRKSSDKTSQIIGVLKSGSKVCVDKIENGMAHISGWSSIKYLQ